MIPTLQTNDSNNESMFNTIFLSVAGWFTAEVAQHWNAWLSNGVLVCTMCYTIAKTIDIFRKKGGQQ